MTAALTANAVSTAGTMMTLLAVPWFVLVTTGSSEQTGLVAACEAVTLVLASGLTGPLVDRVGARAAAVWSDLLSALAVGAVPVLAMTTGLPLPLLCGVVAVLGLVRAPGATARTVLVPGLAELAATPIERATSAFDGVNRGARMAGAPLAGVLIAAFGPADVLLVDAGTFLFSGLVLALTVPFARTTAAPVDEPYLHQLRDGLVGLLRDRLLVGITLMVLVTNLLDAAWSGVLLPVYARDVLHSSIGLGVVFAAFGLGALLGTIAYGAWGPRLPRWPVFTLAFLLVGAPRFGLLATEAPLAVLLVGQLVFGLACGCLNPILSAVEYERVPPALQSRIFAVSSAGVLAGAPLGPLLAGLGIGTIGLPDAVLVTGGLYLLATLAPLLPVWREMDTARPAAVREATLVA